MKRLLDAPETGDAFRRLARQCLTQISEREAGAVARDGESLHKMRVGVRRLRSLFTTFKPALVAAKTEALREELRWLQSILGQCRDWDVFNARHLFPSRERLEDDRLQQLSELGTDAREKAYDALEETVTSSRYRGLHESLQAFMDDPEGVGTPWMGRPVKKFARRALKKRMKKVAHGADDLAELPIGELHELRKQIKKARYALDFFADFYRGKRAKRYLAQLSLMQDLIGQMVDVRAGQALIESVKGGNRVDDETLRGARDIVTGWLIANSADCRAQLCAAWERYRSLKPLR